MLFFHPSLFYIMFLTMSLPSCQRLLSAPLSFLDIFFFSSFFSALFVSEGRPISGPRSGVTARPGKKKNGAMTHRLGCGRVTSRAGRAPPPASGVEGGGVWKGVCG